jgi:tetratricopeptide (TPR) repeat protein
MASILKKLRGGSKRKKTTPQEKVSTESSHEAPLGLPTSSKALHDDDDHTHPLQEFSPSYITPQKKEQHHHHHHHHKLHVPSFFKKHSKKQVSTPETCPTIETPDTGTSATVKRRSRLSLTNSIPTHVATSPQMKPLKSFMRQRSNLAVNTKTSVADPTVLYRNIKSAKNEKRYSAPVPNSTSQQPHNQMNTNTNTQSIRDRNKESERIARAAAALDNKGNEFFERGYYDKAMATYTKALKLKRRTFHKLLEDVDDVLDEALLDEDGCKSDNAEDQKLLVSMATSINNIGYLRQRAGDATPDETMAAYKKSLRIKREILGKDSLSVGKTLNNIGSVHYLKQDYDGALSAYEEALQIMQANLGAMHPDVATVWSNIGDVYLGKKSQLKALEHYRYALTIRWTVFGEHDQRVVRLLEKIAAIEMGGNMMEETRKLYSDRRYFDSMYHGGDSELLDLDMRPMAQELTQLHHEIEEDIQHLDLLQKRMAVDMLKDKVIILRGMRELMAESQQNLEDDSSHDSEQNERADTEDHEDDSESAESIELLSPKRLDMSRVKRHEGDTERAKALQNVKDRVARLREQRMIAKDVEVEDHNTLESTGHVAEEPTTRNSLFGASLYSQPKRPTNASLSHLEADELKGAANSVVSALALKRGISALRDFNMDEEVEVGKATAVF